MEKKQIVERMTYHGGHSPATFVDHWQDGDGWDAETRIELHHIDGSDYYIVIDTSGSDYGFGVPGIKGIELDFGAAEKLALSLL